MLYDKLLEWTAGLLSGAGLVGHLMFSFGLLPWMLNLMPLRDIGVELLAIYSLATPLLIIGQRILPRHKAVPAIWFSLLCIPILGAILFERLPRKSFERTGFDVLPPSTGADSDESQT